MGLNIGAKPAPEDDDELPDDERDELLSPAAKFLVELAQETVELIDDIAEDLPSNFTTGGDSIRAKVISIALTVRKTRSLTSNQKRALENMNAAVEKWNHPPRD